MRYNTYLVMDRSKGIEASLARGMSLETACILVKSLFEAYPEESDISYEIIREPELPHAKICDDKER